MALVFLSGIANGDFITIDTVTQSGPNDVHTFQVMNNGPGSRLLAMDITLQAFSGGISPTSPPNGHLILKTYDAQYNTPPLNDDLDVSNMSAAPDGDRSYIRAGFVSEWQIVSSTPGYESPDDGDPVASNMNLTPWGADLFTPQTITLSQFSVRGMTDLLGGGIPDATPKTFAVAVVPHGEVVRASGQFLAPEPSSVALASAGLFSLLMRRRVRTRLSWRRTNAIVFRPA